MSFRYWHLRDDPEGRRFCFTTEARFTCPFAEGPPMWMTDHAEDEGHDPEMIVRIWKRGHYRVAERKRDAAGRLTDRCAACGYKLDAHGYAAYVERPKRPDEMDEADRTSAAIAARLGTSPPMVRVKTQTGLKRSEARAWAYEQYTMAKAALAEALLSGGAPTLGNDHGRTT